ncbi:uncharacterized protein LOC113209068 [Frankliniella occidentalis]|uniref:Uncharacterized protein LOC113209068 n=1 Tax=Frankliniella occidentalis TaxID=133901 RepID=A0A9C6X1I6_FRAOC|nr:uncharacterized protein LOC113209068 [Frankliniella occidentalis]
MSARWMSAATTSSRGRFPLISVIQYVIMSSILVALLTFLCQDVVFGKAINSFAGPYIFYAERIYMCENNAEMAWRWHFRASHFNPQKPRELQRLTGNLTGVNVTIDDSLGAKILLDIWAQNQWKENAFLFSFKDKACTLIRVLAPTFYGQILKQKETKGDCILKPGIYEANDTPVEWVFPKVPIMPYGRYRMKILLGTAPKLYGCFTAVATMIPKV